MTFEEWLERFVDTARDLGNSDAEGPLRRAFELGDSPEGTASAALRLLANDDDDDDDESPEDAGYREVWAEDDAD